MQSLSLFICLLIAARACTTGRFDRALSRFHGALSSRSLPRPELSSRLSALQSGYRAALHDNSTLSLVAATCGGAADGLHRLADHVFANCASGGTFAACFSSHPKVSPRGELSEAPAFPSRIYSDQGQLLDAPDRGYYSPNGSLNAARVQADIDLAVGLIPELEEKAFTGFMFESSGVEDYINYDRLGAGLTCTRRATRTARAWRPGRAR